MSYFTHMLYPNFFELVMVFESSAFIQIQENGRTAIYLFGDDSLFKDHENLKMEVICYLQALVNIS